MKRFFSIFNQPGPSCLKVDSAIHWINLYRVDNNAIGLGNAYQLDSDQLSDGYSAFHLLNNRDQAAYNAKVHENAPDKPDLAPMKANFVNKT